MPLIQRKAKVSQTKIIWWMTYFSFRNYIFIFIIIIILQLCIYRLVDEFVIYTKKITSIDYQQQIFFLIGPSNHC